MLNQKKIMTFMYFLLALLPSVSAQPFNMRGGLGFMIENIFRNIFDILGRQYVILGITLFAIFMIFFSIYFAASKRIKMFQGEGGSSSQGKAFAVALALLSTFGVFFSIRTNYVETVQRILEMGGLLGIIMLGITIFFLVYYGTAQGENKNTCLALFASGMAIYLMSFLIENYQWMTVGFVLGVAGLICFIVKLFGLFKNMASGGSGGSGGSRGSRGGGGSRGGERTPREKYGDVNVHVLSNLPGNPPVDNVEVQLRRNKRWWRSRGTTAAGRPVHFQQETGRWWIRAVLNNAELARGRFNIGPGSNNINLIVPAGGVGGTLSGRVVDTNNVGIGNATVNWGGLSIRTQNPSGNYIINVPVANYGSHNVAVNAGPLFLPYNSPTPILVNATPPNLNQVHDVVMHSLSPINPTQLNVQYIYPWGPSNVLLSGYTSITIRITRTAGGNFTHPSLVNRFIIERSGLGNSIYTEAFGLILTAPNIYTINNVNTINCIGARYFFT